MSERSGIAAYLAKCGVQFTEDDLDDCSQSIELLCLEDPSISRDEVLCHVCSDYAHQWNIDRGRRIGPQKNGTNRKHFPEYPESFLTYLTPRQRSIAALLQFDLTMHQIADRLSTTANNVRVISCRIRTLYSRYLKAGYPFLKRCTSREPIK